MPLIAERNLFRRQKQESTRLIYEWKLKAGLNQCDQLDDQEWFKHETKGKDVEIAVLQLLTQSEEATRIHLKIPKPFATLAESRLFISTGHSRSLDHRSSITEIHTASGGTVTQFEQSLYDWSQTQHQGTLHQAIRNTGLARGAIHSNVQPLQQISCARWEHQQNAAAICSHLFVIFLAD